MVWVLVGAGVCTWLVVAAFVAVSVGRSVRLAERQNGLTEVDPTREVQADPEDERRALPSLPRQRS